MNHPPLHVWLRSLLVRGLLFALGWLLLTEGDLRDLWVGLLILVTALWTSYQVLDPGSVTSLRPLGLLRFAGYFIMQSLRGGIDVASRALRPSMPLQPGFREVPVHLRSEGLRVLFAWTVSLLPGTASVRLQEHSLVVHALVDSPEVDRQLRELEEVIAGLRRAPAGPQPGA